MVVDIALTNFIMIYFITGGERSGKSRFAQDLALKLTSNPVYCATARVWDQDFENRVHRHQNDRDARWTNIHIEKEIGAIQVEQNVILIDCVTLWLTNWYVDFQYDIDSCLVACKEQLNQLFLLEKNIIIISNEIGMGVHATTEMGRKFVELQGWINQEIAQKAHHVVFMVSGLPLIVKKNGKTATII